MRRSVVLTQATIAAVRPSSQVLTDGWNDYAKLKAKGYRHSVVRESAVVGANLLPRANRVAALAVGSAILSTHGASDDPQFEIIIARTGTGSDVVGKPAVPGAPHQAAKRHRVFRSKLWFPNMTGRKNFEE